VEYPVTRPGPDGTLLVGSIDLVSMDSHRLPVIDFKTDAPPGGAADAAYPPYAAQVRLYSGLLGQSPALRDLETQLVLLFTADVSFHEISPREPAGP
jgi:ATP-dependent helicase/nuclease subunit A